MLSPGKSPCASIKSVSKIKDPSQNPNRNRFAMLLINLILYGLVYAGSSTAGYDLPQCKMASWWLFLHGVFGFFYSIAFFAVFSSSDTPLNPKFFVRLTLLNYVNGLSLWFFFLTGLSAAFSSWPCMTEFHTVGITYALAHGLFCIGLVAR